MQNSGQKSLFARWFAAPDAAKAVEQNSGAAHPLQNLDFVLRSHPCELFGYADDARHAARHFGDWAERLGGERFASPEECQAPVAALG